MLNEIALVLDRDLQLDQGEIRLCDTNSFFVQLMYSHTVARVLLLLWNTPSTQSKWNGLVTSGC